MATDHRNCQILRLSQEVNLGKTAAAPHQKERIKKYV